MAEHQVAGGDVRNDGVHAAAVAAAFIVQLHNPRSHFYACFCHNDLGRPCLVLFALLTVFWDIPSDEVWTLRQCRQSDALTRSHHHMGDTLDMLRPRLLQYAAV